MYDLDKIRGAVFSLQYHLITAMKEIINKIASDFDVQVLEIECGDDYLHILFKTKPTLDMTKFINILKGHSSREIRKSYKDFLKDKLWGDNFWSPSYFLSTTGNVSVDILKKYIENQKELQE